MIRKETKLDIARKWRSIGFGIGRRRLVTRGVIVIRQRAHRRCPRCGELPACD